MGLSNVSINFVISKRKSLSDMLSRRLNEKTLHKLSSLLETDTGLIVITAHQSPDGDATGSSLALCRVLESLGRNVKVVLPDNPPSNLSFLDGFKEIIIASRYPDFASKLFADASMIFCLDFNEPSRVGCLENDLRQAKGKKVLIDHHLDPDTSSFDISLSYPEMSSTCFLLFRVLCRLRLFELIDSKAAECILSGMLTDTGDLAYNCSDPEIFTVVAELIKKGADKQKLTQALFDTFSANCLKLNGYAISEKMEVFPDLHAALITLSREELNRYHYTRGDTEGLVNRPLAIPGIIYSAFLREETDYIKVSMRSKGDFPVNILCSRHFGGGGHKNAAGGEFKGSLKQCAQLFRSLLPQNKEEFLSSHPSSTLSKII